MSRSIAKYLLHCATALAGIASPLAAASYFVSPSGSDASLGTIDQPFFTIQKAATILAAGDTVFIRAGVYRETVTPKNSGAPNAPIMFMPYNGESVTVSGADVIDPASWSVSGGNIYQAPMNQDLGDGANQLFLDGQMMIEARWPNTTLDVSHPIVAKTASGTSVDGGSGLSTGTMTDPNLPQRPDGYWNGATLQIALGPAWIWQAGRVVNSTAAQLRFTFAKQGDVLVPGARNSYFLTGKLSELDAAGEWFIDKTSASVYLWPPQGDNPGQHLVEVKRRRLAFDLRARGHIVVQGLSLFAATVDSDSGSYYLVIDGIQASYIAHTPLPVGQGSYSSGSDAGIALRGHSNVLKNSSIQFSSGSGVWVEGSGSRVINNSVRDTDYIPTYASPIASVANQYILAYNTISSSGRFGINHPGSFGTGRILHNEIFDYGLQTNDLGCTYTYQADGKGTEIAYNLCHEGHGLLISDSQVYVAGVYLDNGSHNFLVHHNVAWNVQWALHLNDPSTNNKVYNNTLVGLGSSLLPYGDDHTDGTEIRNNIFVGPMRPNLIGAVLSNNILPGTDPQFVDSANHNFQLKPSSPAIGAGIAIPGITDRSVPDIGAFDHTMPPWKAGVQSAAYTVSAADGSLGLTAGGRALISGTIPFDQNTTVLFTDGAGIDTTANILSVSGPPGQLSFEVPANAAAGVAMITIANSDGTVSVSSAPVFPNVQPRVLFDETHSESDSIDASKASLIDPVHPTWRYLNTLAGEMKASFYRVSRLTTGSLTPAVLSGTDVLVLAAPAAALTPAETAAVKAFVENGGGLIFIGSCCASSSINNLIGPWGMTLDPKVIYSGSTGSGGFKIQTFATDPALPASPSFFTASWGGSLNVSSTAVALAQTSAMEWKSISGKTSQQSGDPNGPFAILASAQAGKGRIFASGDESFTEISPEGNRQIFLSALAWLTAGLYSTPTNAK